MAVDNIARGMAASALKNQGGGGSSLPIVNTASVGQTIRVSAVDETGMPTEWEAVEFPAGGGWEVITDIEMSEDGDSAATMLISVDDKGNKFAYREIMVTIFGTIIDGLQKTAVNYVKAQPYPNDDGTGYLPYEGLLTNKLGAGGSNVSFKMHYRLFRNAAITDYTPLSSNSMMFKGDLIRGDYLIRSIKLMCNYTDANGNKKDAYVPYAAGGRITIYGRN